MAASCLESFSKWLKLKIYQFEVTLSVYIYTPIEKFILYSVLFLLFSLTFIASVMYLPDHLMFIFDRAWFYMHGDSPETLVTSAKEAGQVLVQTTVAAATAGSTMVREL